MNRFIYSFIELITTHLCTSKFISGAFFVHIFGNAPLINYRKMHQ